MLVAEPTVTLAAAIQRAPESCCADDDADESGGRPCSDESPGGPCTPGCADCLCCPHVRLLSVTLADAMVEPSATVVTFHRGTSAEPSQPDPGDILHVPKRDA